MSLFFSPLFVDLMVFDSTSEIGLYKQRTGTPKTAKVEFNPAVVECFEAHLAIKVKSRRVETPINTMFECCLLG